jgi:hypothetical protein
VRVSKTKLQFVEEEVKYLEHLISKGKHKLDCEWFEGITGMPLSETKWEHQKFLGLMGYCRLWIESYFLKCKDLYSKILEEETEPLLWKLEEVQIVESLKHSLITLPVLALPSLEDPFHLFVNVDKGTALGILAQEHRGKNNLQPTYFNSLTL